MTHDQHVEPVDALSPQIWHHDALARITCAGIARSGIEQQRVPGRIVVGVRLPQGVRVDPQPGDVLVVGPLSRDDLAVGVPPQVGGPERPASEGHLELADGPHRHGVGHLLVEARVPLRRREAVLGQ